LFIDVAGQHWTGLKFTGESMIEIDLFPPELRKKPKRSLNLKFKIDFKKKLLFTVLGYIVLLHVLLHLLTAINSKRITVLKRNRQGLASEKTQVDELKAQLAQLNSKIPLIQQLINNQVIWSKKLNRISDLLVNGIWLNEIGLKREDAEQQGEFWQTLIIQGSAASRSKDEPALIGRFMQNLKDDPAFSDDFADIELGPIKKRQIAETEVMDFTLICQFKPERLKALTR